MKWKLVALCMLLPALCFAQTFNILKFGAHPDSLSNTKVIQRAIDKAAAEGGGTVYIPKGTFKTGALFFKPATKLKLAKDAVLLGSDDINDYPYGPSRIEGVSQPYYAALINADGVDGFRITGGGTIDGNGLKFWKAFWARRAENPDCTNLEVSRPRLLFIQNAKHIKIKNVRLRNAGFWTTHLYKCHFIEIENCDIRSPFEPIKAPSTDAIDLDVCSNVRIRNCYFSVNDDAVTIKGGKGPYADALPENGMVENVVVQKCTFGRSHGCVTLGSECIHARNIEIKNCRFETDNITPLLRLKLRPDTPQKFENISVQNCKGHVGKLIEVLPWTQFYDLKDKKEPLRATIKNIAIKDMNLSMERIGYFETNPNDSVQNIRIENSVFVVKKGNADFNPSHKKAFNMEFKVIEKEEQ